MEKTSVEKLIEALNGVVQYSGLYHYIREWRELLFNSLGNEENFSTTINDGCEDDYIPLVVQGQLEFIWMILVQLYGTSLYSGCIENKEGALNFIDMILAG